ncbi:MAG: hypothetical protein ACI389_05270 [Methanobrevibacter sp.]|uniref:hypothetical protein n=1 Tax=Methanobrevibacter sp. TaxID=66852 RepID=UPI003F0FE69E
MPTPDVTLECFSFIVDDGKNRVSWDFQDSWICTCEDFYYRKHECKHIRAVKKELRTQVNHALFDDNTCYNKLSTTKQSRLV